MPCFSHELRHLAWWLAGLARAGELRGDGRSSIHIRACGGPCHPYERTSFDDSRLIEGEHRHSFESKRFYVRRLDEIISHFPSGLAFKRPGHLRRWLVVC